MIQRSSLDALRPAPAANTGGASWRTRAACAAALVLAALLAPALRAGGGPPPAPAASANTTTPAEPGPAAPPPAVESTNHGRVLLYRIDAPSIRDTARSVRVFLPPDYRNPASRTRRYPVVYLLHGWPGGDGNWAGRGRAVQTLDSLTAAGRIPPVIAVMPKGNGIGLWGRSLYIDSYDGRSRMMSFIVHDLVGWVDGSFRTLADSTHRAIIGLSEGGTAALNITFQHPEVFGACGGHSGQYNLKHDIGMSPVFGHEPGATRMREANSPTLYADQIAPRLMHVTIYFDCGTGDGELKDNRALHQKLAALGIPHTYREFPGHHGWGYWKIHLHESLIACLAGMR